MEWAWHIGMAIGAIVLYDFNAFLYDIGTEYNEAWHDKQDKAKCKATQ